MDWYFTKAKNWKEEIKKPRTIVLECALNEELKWVVLVARFRKATSVHNLASANIEGGESVAKRSYCKINLSSYDNDRKVKS